MNPVVILNVIWYKSGDKSQGKFDGSRTVIKSQEIDGSRTVMCLRPTGR